MTLLDFWNTYELSSIFIVSTACPSGMKYTNNTEGEGEDYCDIKDLLDTGLFAQPIDGSQPWLYLNGTDEEGVWEWDGEGQITDNRGNNYLRITLR